jgi:tRNA(Ile)-lysidine synthase
MIVESVRHFLEQHHIEGRILAACSGGADSTALTVALHELGVPFVCGHVNHHLRGEESNADEAFVRDLCARLGVELLVADGSLAPQQMRRLGVEAAAREVRQARLRELAARAGARFIATAHQKNDQAETILMRLATGTGLAGLRGIHAVREDGFIRPLLEISRGEIEEYLAARRIVPRRDTMNVDPRYLRNRARAALAQLDPGAMAVFASIAGQAQHIWPLVEKALDDVPIEVTGDETRFLSWPDDPWFRQALLLRHIRRLGSAREISAADLERIVSQLDTIKRITVTKDLELVRRLGTLVLRRIRERTAEFEIALSACEPAIIAAIEKTLTVAPIQNPKSEIQNLFQLPTGAVPRFTVRNRRKGDRFHPLGMPRDKKLKDFLIDRKIPADERDRIPLLIWNGEIVWIAGVEVSERFKVTSPAGVLYEVVLEDASQESQNGVQR